MIDNYTRFILTIIALLLFCHLMISIFDLTPVRAKSDVLDVNIKAIGGSTTYLRSVPVDIMKINGKLFQSSRLPVDVH